MSLFKKYRVLLSSLTKHELFRDYLSQGTLAIQEHAILLPNGYIRTGKGAYQLVVSPRNVYEKKLYRALEAVDQVQYYLSSFKEAQQVMAWYLGVGKYQPPVIKGVHFTTTTFNPSAGAIDGFTSRGDPGGLSWASIRGGNGTGASDGGNQYVYIESTSNAGSPWREMDRGYQLFNTSALGASASITAAVFSLYANSKSDQFSQSIRMVQSTVASNSALANSDYEGTVANTVAQATDVAISAITTSAYNDWTLNVTGRGNISKTSISKFGTKLTADADNTEPSFSSSLQAYVLFDTGGASNPPKLTITFTSALLDDYAYFL